MLEKCMKTCELALWTSVETRRSNKKDKEFDLEFVQALPLSLYIYTY